MVKYYGNVYDPLKMVLQFLVPDAVTQLRTIELSFQKKMVIIISGTKCHSYMI